MPNTLVHIGINGIISKKIINNSNLIWIYIGTILPDFPWILRKVISSIFPSINGFDLQSYVIVQSSFFFCILLSLSLALWDKNIIRTFITLVLGSFLHLLVDPLQIKWANGVHLFAPFSWDLINFSFFWPESILNYFLTLIGFVYFLINWRNYSSIPKYFQFNKIKISLSIVTLFVYCFLPFNFIDSVVDADNHFISTIKNVNERTGKYVEMDRRRLVFDETDSLYYIETFDKSLIKLSSKSLPKVNRISIKGNFINNNEIEVTDYHENNNWFRDGASYFGIFLILLFFLRNTLYNKFLI